MSKINQILTDFELQEIDIKQAEKLILKTVFKPRVEEMLKILSYIFKSIAYGIFAYIGFWVTVNVIHKLYQF